MSGTVYFFKHKDLNGIKIGFTTSESVKSRFQQFCTYSPTGGVIVGTIQAEDPRELEKTLHVQYADKRISGEFFDITEDEVIKTVKTYEPKVSDFFNNLEIAKSYYQNKNNDFNKKKTLDKLIQKAIATIDCESRESENKYDNRELKILSLISPYKNNEYTVEQKSTPQGIIDKYNIDFANNVWLGIFLKRNNFKQKRVKLNGQSRRVYTYYTKIPTP